MPNQRISELPESGPLYYNDVAFNDAYVPPPTGGVADDWFLMTARPKVSNEKISFENFKRSVLTDTIFLKGNQTISGHKTFKDKCYITKRANIDSMQDLSQEGSISGNGFVGKTGFFEKLYFNTTGDIDSQCSVFTLSDACFEGNLQIQGTIEIPSGINSEGDFGSKNLTVSGTQQFNQDLFVEDDLLLSGNILAHGTESQFNDLYSENIYIDDIHSSSGESILFASGDVHISGGGFSYATINDSEFVIGQNMNINSDAFAPNVPNPSGVLHFSGEGYCETLHVAANGTYRPFLPGDEESMIFKNNLQSGYRSFSIDLPKTFYDPPVLGVNMQHLSGGYIIPFIVSDSTTYDFKIQFGEDILDDNFVIHTTAMSPSTGKYASNTDGIQRFKTTLPSGVDSHTINFPRAHNIKPTVNILLEGQNEIVPYTISGVNTNNYTIFLSAETTEDYIVHTISTELDSQRIS